MDNYVVIADYQGGMDDSLMPNHVYLVIGATHEQVDECLSNLPEPVPEGDGLDRIQYLKDKGFTVIEVPYGTIDDYYEGLVVHCIPEDE